MKDLISDIIIRAIQEKAKDDPIIGGFLTTLLFEEAGHPEIWQYTKYYMNKIEECSKKRQEQ